MEAKEQSNLKGISKIQQKAANNITRCYEKLAKRQSSVVWEVIQPTSTIDEWQHYPHGDIKDSFHKTQYFYHAHHSKDHDRVKEHGHFHIFFRPGIIPSQAKPIITSNQYKTSNGLKDNLCHIIAISMDNKGMPIALFTVNHWVTLGAWYSAKTISNALQKFKVEIDNSKYFITNSWITNMILLFMNPIQDLLVKRDEIIASYNKSQEINKVFYDKSLEITSLFHFGKK